MRYACLACWKSCNESELLEPDGFRRLPLSDQFFGPEKVGCPNCHDSDNLYPLDEVHEELIGAARHDEDHRQGALDLIETIIELRDSDIADRDRTIKSLRDDADHLRRLLFEARRDANEHRMTAAKLQGTCDALLHMNESAEDIKARLRRAIGEESMEVSNG